MSQVILKEGEIKWIKGSIEKFKQEVQEKDERVTKFQKERALSEMSRLVTSSKVGL
jgi:hypothetical protein